MLKNKIWKEANFSDAYIERCDKESEQLISIENTDFLKKRISFLKENKNEFLYLESTSLNVVEADALSIEVDDVFGTYDVMLGLKLKKKYQSSLKRQLNILLSGEEPKFDLIFNQEDGLWDLNFTLNYVNSFNEDISIENALMLIYSFLFHLLELVENSEQ